MSKEVVSIQYLRGGAAIMVVLHHMLSPITEIDYIAIPGLGRFGVEIFFVISGFIMWHTTATSDISPVEFWRRRVVRIVPLYWLFLSLLVLTALLFPRLFHSTTITPENVTKSFLFIPHFHVVQTGLIAPILIPGWSLDYEMFFYLVFGLVMFLPSRGLRATILGLCLSGLVLLGFALQPTGALLSTYTNPDLLKFLDGIVLAVIYRGGWLNFPKLGSALIAAGILFSLFAAPTSSFARLDDLLGFSATSVVAGALAMEARAKRSPSLVFLAIGSASYSIYLSHLFFLRATELIGQRLSLFGVSKALDATYIVIALTLSIVGGICIHYFIERPILSLRHRRRSAILTEPTSVGSPHGQHGRAA
jgi:exopolysaccharide production protein ExoZ